MTESQASPGASRRAFLTGAGVCAAGIVGAPMVANTAEAAEGISVPEWPDGPGKLLRPQQPDAELRAILAAIDPARIEATIRKLVSFGTRHTLSSQDDPNRGIGAARDWIAAEMRRYAEASGGRMTVTVPSYIQQPAARIPEPTRISNVVATLTGSVDPNRAYVVSGHYDSRVTDVMNFTADAPGANDDASGVAAVLEMARIMASQHTEATLVFAAVAGEEQGLYGSAHMAQVMKGAGVDVQGMFTNDIIGSSTADDGTRDPGTVRLFAEGVPTAETPQEASIRQSVGGENDS